MRDAVSIRLQDEAATVRLGREIAGTLHDDDAVLLEGELGSGKTTLARALIRTRKASVSLHVPSPSYTLVQDYDGIAHLDLWRLDGPDALEELGWRELRHAGIVVVEWPDRLGPLRPDGALTVRLAPDGDGRVATLAGWPPARLATFARSAAP